MPNFSFGVILFSFARQSIEFDSLKEVLLKEKRKLGKAETHGCGLCL